MRKSQFFATTLLVLVAITAPVAVYGQTLLPNHEAVRAPNSQTTWEGVVEGGQWPTFVTLTVRPEEARLEGALVVLGQTLPFSEAAWTGQTLSLRIGEGEQALHLSGRREDNRLVGELRQGNAARPFSLREVPAYPAPRDRVEAWNQDLDVLSTRFIAADRSFTAAERAMFLEAIEATRQSLIGLSDAQIIMRMASAIALANNAHTRLYILRNRQELRRLPVRLWWFSDGLRVVRTTPGYRHLLGCRVADIAGTNARPARDIVGQAFAGNPSWRDYKSVYALTSPEALAGVRIINTPDHVGFGIADCPGAGDHAIEPLPLVRSDSNIEAWWDLSPLHEYSSGDWVHVLGHRQTIPLYLRNPNKNYWFEFNPESGILYFQFNRSQNAEGENIPAFGERLLAELERRRPRAFVMDVRFNTGGNLTLGTELMRSLQERTAGIARFVITGRATFSAGITHVVQWREGGNVMIVGEPVGDVLDTWAEGGNIRLPNSGLDAHFANGAHSYSPAPCPVEQACLDMSVESVEPDKAAAASWADYLAGRDPAMEAIARQLTAPGT